MTLNLEQTDTRDIDGRFYVYLLSSEGKTFYVGKGCGNRVKRSLNPQARDFSHRANKIRSLRKDNKPIESEVIFTTNNEDTAFVFEKFTIAMFGRPYLSNLTDGGEGCSGYTYTMSPEHKEKLRKAKLGVPSKLKGITRPEFVINALVTASRNKNKYSYLEGKEIGLLTMLHKVDEVGSRGEWLAQCRCGTVKKVLPKDVVKQKAGIRTCGSKACHQQYLGEKPHVNLA